jgi:hypothetical protein
MHKPREKRLHSSHNLYRLSVVSGHGATKLLRPQESFVALVRPVLHSIQLWHQRLGHVCIPTIKKMAVSKMADGLIISEENQDYFCEGCLLGKQHRLPFFIGRTRGTHVGHIVHSYVCGQISVPDIGKLIFSLLKTILVDTAQSISSNRNPK